jgi:hypothetical protein
MNIETTIAPSRKYLVCRVLVPVTAEVARQIAVETEKLSEESGIQSRLIDVRNFRNISSVSGNYDLAYKDLDELQVARCSRAAVLVSSDDSSHDFAMTAIRNAGFNVRKFNDQAAAIAWLEED